MLHLFKAQEECSSQGNSFESVGLTPKMRLLLSKWCHKIISKDKIIKYLFCQVLVVFNPE